MKKLLLNRWTLSVIGILLLALVIWFLGPYFAFGEARPMYGVTGRVVAILLLLLDRWPLERLAFPALDAPARAWWERLRPFLVEKIPFIAAAAAAALATLLIQHQAGAMGEDALRDGSVGLAWSGIPNAIVGYARYLAMHLWPSDLMVLYPHPTKPHAGGIPLEDWQVVLALLFLCVSTAIVVRLRKPVLAVGWSWYLVSLVPVIGIIQIGSHAVADRYAYLPSVGLFVMVCFGIAQGWEARGPATPSRRAWRTFGIVLVLCAYAASARSAGLPRMRCPTTTAVSAASTGADACPAAARRVQPASALARATRCT